MNNRKPIRDKERLDWLLKKATIVVYLRRRLPIRGILEIRENYLFNRQAIDAAAVKIEEK